MRPAATSTANVVETPSTGPASADPIGTPEKFRAIATANARPNHARAVRRWRSENALTLEAASAPPAIAIPTAISASDGSSNARTATPMTAPNMDIDSRSRPSVRIRPATSAAGIPAAPASARIEPTTAALPGTLVIVYNNPTIYVVGTDGVLHGFATPAQFLGDGYDPADVITVPNYGHLTVGATAGSLGPAGNALATAANGAVSLGPVVANALATAANGALVNSSGTFYVLAGGRAFGIANEVVLRAIEAADTARPIAGTVGPALTGATISNGTLLTVSGEVYVSYGGGLYPFKSPAQLKADGYGGTRAEHRSPGCRAALFGFLSCAVPGS